MLISSAAKLALVKINKDLKEQSLTDVLETYFSDVDIVLTEGFKKSAMPKIEVNRKERSRALICRGQEHDDTLLAVASDDNLDVDVPLFDINDSTGICDFIEERFLS